MSTRIGDVGTPIKNFRGWAITEVKFYGFADLPTTRDEYVISPEFSCFGHQWTCEIYPGGHSESDEGNVAVALTNLSNTGIKIQYGFSVRDDDTDSLHMMENGEDSLHYASLFVIPSEEAARDEARKMLHKRLEEDIPSLATATATSRQSKSLLFEISDDQLQQMGLYQYI